MIGIKNQKILTKYTKQIISDYLEFDVDDIYNETDYAYIFGGAIRDSIVGDKINDVDILCLPHSMRIVEEILINNSYTREDYTKNDIASLYTDIHIIFEPFTYFKGAKKIQLIRPAPGNPEDYISTFLSILSNVDLSCCGIYYDGRLLKESCLDSMYHIINKDMILIPKATMYNEKRVNNRIYKLEQKHWTLLKSGDGYDPVPDSDKIKTFFDSLYRDMNIDEIIEESD
jgi:hypothetical protein